MKYHIYSKYEPPNYMHCVESTEVRKFMESQTYVWFSVTVHNLKCFGTKLYSAGTQHGNLYPSVVMCLFYSAGIQHGNLYQSVVMRRVTYFILQALNMETCISLL